METLEHRRQGGGNGGALIIVALAQTDGSWRHLIIEVLAAEPNGFHEAPPAPVEALDDQWGGSVHAREHEGDLFACHDHRDVDLLVGAHGMDATRQSMGEDARVEKH
jgi:hypothetical protein